MADIRPATMAVMALLVFGGPTACRASAVAPSTAPATSQPADALAAVKFESAPYAFSVEYPGNWTPINKGGDFVLALVPAATKGKDAGSPLELDIEVPKLPPHIPGMIPIGSVADGYIDDLKKRYPETHVDERIAVTVAGGNARRVVSSMKDQNRPWRDMAVLACHSDRVYIFSADCSVEDYATTRAAFDSLVASMKWTK
jgi:hypothetical protein